MSFDVTSEEKGSSGGSKIEPPKSGPRLAVLTGVIDVGVQQREYQGDLKKPSREFLPVFTLVYDSYKTEEGEEVNFKSRPGFPIKVMPGASKSKYMAFVNAIDPNHKILDKDGLGDLTKLCGGYCYVNIEHNTVDKDGVEVTYGNYRGVSPIPEDYPLPDREEEEFTLFSLRDPSRELWDSFNDRLKGQIKEGIHWVGSDAETFLCGGGDGAVEPSVNPELTDDRPF